MSEDHDPSSIELLDGAAFRQLAEQEPDGWLLDHIFPRAGPCLLVGRPTAGKSRFLSALSVCVASGTPLAGRRVESGPVVWIYLEHMRRTLVNGLDAAAAGLEIAAWDQLPIRFVHVPGDVWTPSDDMLARTIAAIDAAGAALVVVDSLRRAGTHRENASEEVAGTMRWLAALSSGNRRTVVGIHHTTKDGRSVRGSEEFEAAADSTVFLSRAKDDDSVPTEVFARHHGAAPVDWTLRVEHSDSLLRYIPAKTEADQGNRPLRLDPKTLRLASEAIRAGRCDTIRSLRDTLKIGHREALTVVGALEDRGVVSRTPVPGRDGWFTLVWIDGSMVSDGVVPEP